MYRNSAEMLLRKSLSEVPVYLILALATLAGVQLFRAANVKALPSLPFFAAFLNCCYEY